MLKTWGKIMVVALFFGFLGCGKVYATDYITTEYKTPGLWIQNSDNISDTSLPFTWTASGSASLMGYGMAFTDLPAQVIIDGFKYKFTITSDSSGWSFFPTYSVDSGATYSSPTGGCGLNNIYLGTNPCQYNTINGTSTNYVIASPINTSSPITRSHVNIGAVNFKWVQTGGTKTVTISNFQVAVVYHVGIETLPEGTGSSFQCPEGWILSDVCTLIGGLFVPSAEVRAEYNTIAQEVRTTKAPWVYMDTLLGTTMATSSGALADVSLADIPPASGSGVSWDFSDVTALASFSAGVTKGYTEFPHFILDIFGYIRSFFSFVVWGYFAMYLILRFKNGII